MAGVTSSDSNGSDAVGQTIPGSSRIVALLSIVPVLLVIAGLVCYYCISLVWRKKTKLRWRPFSLQTPTLLLYFALILALIMLLESASLALPGSQTSQTDDTTDDSTKINSALTSLATQAAEFDAAYTDTTSQPLTTRGGEPTAPAPGVGWLSLSDDGWLSAQTSYFIGTFLPTLLASLFSVLWKVLDTETKSLEPFAQLTKPGGGTASDTILLNYSGLNGFFSSIAGFFNGHSAVALSTLLKYSSALLIPLSAEAVHLKLQGGCLQDWTDHCTSVLEVSDTVIRVSQALLVFMACLNIAYIVLASRRNLGVSFDPRSMLGIASLSINPYLSALMRELPMGPDGMFLLNDASSTLGNHKFEFGRVIHSPGQGEYGITVTNSDAQNLSPLDKSTSTSVDNTCSSRRSIILGSFMWLGLAMFLIGLCILILYYRLTDDDTGFERFMDTQNIFGVRFLFTVFGVVVGFGWAAIFQQLATIHPAFEMSQRPATAKQSILMPLSPSPYQGVVTYLRHGHKLLALVSLATILSDFLPIALANIPFSNAITWSTFDICTWVSLGVLFFMLLVLVIVMAAILYKSSSVLSPLGSESWGTPAAVLYLVCHNDEFVSQLHGLSTARTTEVNRMAKALNTRYCITRSTHDGGSGPLRLQVLSDS